jgi:hypothetical protein
MNQNRSLKDNKKENNLENVSINNFEFDFAMCHGSYSC